MVNIRPRYHQKRSKISGRYEGPLGADRDWGGKGNLRGLRGGKFVL